MYEVVVRQSTTFSHGQRASFSYGASVTMAAEKLKALRETAEPRLSIRRLAEAVNMPPSSYAFYEDSNKFKKRYLPVEFARALVEPMAAHGIDRQEVLALAGTGDAEPDSEVALPPALSDLDLVGIEQIDLAYGMGATFTDGPVRVDTRYFPRSWVETITSSPAELLFWGQGRGDSMVPTIHDRDMILFDRSQRRVVEQDAIWAFTLGDLGAVKRLRVRGDRVTILSDNPSVPADEATVDEINIVARVIFVGRTF